MALNSDQIHLNADSVLFDRQNGVLGFNSSGSNVTAHVSSSETLSGHLNGCGGDKKDCSVGDDVVTNDLAELISGPVMAGFDMNSICDVMPDGGGKESFCLEEVVPDVVEGGCGGKPGPVMLGFDMNPRFDAMVDGCGKERFCVEKMNDSEEVVPNDDKEGCGGKPGEFSSGLVKDEDMKNVFPYSDEALHVNGGVEHDKGLAFEFNDDFHIELKCENAGIFASSSEAQGVDDDLIECRHEIKNSVNLSADDDSVTKAENHFVTHNDLEIQYDLKQPAFQEDTQVNVNVNQSMDINIVGAGISENILHDCRGCNLVVDLNSYRESLFPEVKFRESDLVWGKVSGHPWWPGQICDPSIASETVKRYYKENCYLVAYFGVHTFSWNDMSMIKPFQTHFSQMEKQSNLENFQYAVDCALEEVSRRVESRMHCRCMPEEVCSKLQTQVIANAQVIKQSSRRNGEDKLTNATSFEPMKLVNFVKSLAQSPHGELDRLDFVIARARLSGFYSSKGYSQLPEFAVLGWLFKNDMEILPVREEAQCGDQRFLNTHQGFFQLSSDISRNGKQPGKKLKLVSDLMSEKNFSISNGDKSTSQRRRGRKRKVDNNSSGDYVHSSKVKKPTPIQFLSTNEMWSQLCLAAKEPAGESWFGDMICFFGEFKKFTGLDDSASLERGVSLEQMHGGETTGVTSIEAVASSTNTMELCSDSYWTDRIIQGISEEQTLLNNQNDREEILPEIPTEANPSSFKSQPAAEISTDLGLMQQDADRSSGSEPSNLVEDLETSPTALTLKFTNLDSVPSTTDLNTIFGRFGPLIERKTELLKKTNCARVIFKRRSDAETAFSSAGKYSIFGPSLVSYRLKILPRKPKLEGTGKRGRPRKKERISVYGAAV